MILKALVALGLRDSPARGTMEAMVQLASMAAQEPYLLPQILPVFYHHLQREIDPMGPSAHITLAFKYLPDFHNPMPLAPSHHGRGRYHSQHHSPLALHLALVFFGHRERR